jgi:hypothetical protein
MKMIHETHETHEKKTKKFCVICVICGFPFLLSQVEVVRSCHGIKTI